jgi:hypothetical protein
MGSQQGFMSDAYQLNLQGKFGANLLTTLKPCSFKTEG